MGLFDRLKGLKADYDTRKAEQARISQEESKLVKDYNLKRTGQAGRYLVGGDQVIDVNVSRPESVKAARDVLDKRDLSPTLRRISPKQAKEFTRGAAGGSRFGSLADIGTNFNANAGDFFGGGGGGMGNYDFMGGGFGSDFDFLGGGTSKPRKRKKSSKRKTRR
ncbi:MAG: hypothetical protein WC343_13435 [Bacilli bacterium]|jgi:hypothetical protein